MAKVLISNLDHMARIIPTNNFNLTSEWIVSWWNFTFDWKLTDLKLLPVQETETVRGA
jgi:hypothetical protein